MREQEKISNSIEDKKNINRPVIIIVSILVILIMSLIWFGIKDRTVFSCVRDFLIVLTLFIFFLVNVVLAFLAFLIAYRVDNSKRMIDELSTKADNTIEDLADKITKILQKILAPVIEMKSKEAGLLRIFSKK